MKTNLFLFAAAITLSTTLASACTGSTPAPEGGDGSYSSEEEVFYAHRSQLQAAYHDYKAAKLASQPELAWAEQVFFRWQPGTPDEQRIHDVIAGITTGLFSNPGFESMTDEQIDEKVEDFFAEIYVDRLAEPGARGRGDFPNTVRFFRSMFGGLQFNVEIIDMFAEKQSQDEYMVYMVDGAVGVKAAEAGASLAWIESATHVFRFARVTEAGRPATLKIVEHWVEPRFSIVPWPAQG